MTGASGQLRMVASDDPFIVYGDVNGDRVAHFAVATALQAGDFIL